MLRLAWLPGICALTLLAAPAAAETCNQSGISSIDSACAISGGTVSGCTPDCSDAFSINGSVTQTGDVAMTVVSGDALIIRSGGHWDSAGFDLSYDTGGLRVFSGGTFSMNGSGFREWGQAPVTRTEPSPWPIGSYLPCPTPGGASDCNAGDNNRVRFGYDPARSDADVPASLAALTTNDVVCGYYDPDTMAPIAASWTNSCFEVAAIDARCTTIADCYLELEMDQSWLGRPSRDYPLDRRRVIEAPIAGGYAGAIAFGGAPTAQVEPGQRRLCLSGTSASMTAGTPDAVAKNQDLIGRFLRFSEPAGSLPLDWSYVINGLEYHAASCDALPACDGDCHLVSISDPRGFAEPHGAGEPVWIDYGFLSSDRFAVLAQPPVLTGLHADEGFAGRVEVAGTISLRNAVAVDVGTFDLDGATIDALEWLFVSDPTPGIEATYGTQDFVFKLENNTFHTDAIHHINVVGGPGFASCDNTARTGPGTGSDSCNYGLHVFTSRGQTHRFRDVSMSHNEDDCMAGIQGGGGTLDVERLYCGPSGDGAFSSNFIDLFDRNNHVVRAEDIICTNCSNDLYDLGGEAPAIFKLIAATTPVSTLNRVSVIGAVGDFNANILRERAEFTNVYLSGQRTAASGTRAGPGNLEFFVIEDVHPDLDRDPAGAYWQPNDLRLLRAGIVRNSSLSGTRSALQHPSDGTIDNVLFLNLDKSGLDPVDNALVQLRVDDTFARATYRNVTIAYQAGIVPSGIDTIFDARGLTGKTYNVHDMLIANAPVSRGVAATDIRGLANSDGWCLFDAGSIDDAPNFPPDTVFDRDPDFWSPGTGDYRTPFDGDCGASGIRGGVDTPGLKQHGYYLSALHLSPKILNRMDGVIWRLSGVASGGSIEVSIDGVRLTVLTAAGQRADEVAANLAAAINADGSLASQGVGASVDGPSVSTNGLVYDVSIDDPGLNTPAQVPGLAPAALALAWLSLTLAAYAVFATRRVSRA